MAQIIANTYEIDEKIGSGGGGVVYLGRHIRLNKTVVLKADKRKLNASQETLRREVDMLKNLSHTYIPQVYDFIQEGEEVFTVMDYIDGESLDKVLKRKQKIEQPQIIKWACQLLEALDYLHKQPPYGILHGDIKPANVMLRANGDICLIDYNIALALGENGAVKVGFSRGYASPEHYSSDFSVDYNVNENVDIKCETEKTEILPTGTVLDAGTEKLFDAREVSRPIYRAEHSNSSSSSNGILLDARSDIYSLGATLYHLISGQKPNHDAEKVIPLSKDICSTAISKILQKAMSPKPENRYQNAQEMLQAFKNLYKTDIRAVRHKRKVIAASVSLAVLFACGAASTFIGLSQMKQRENALALAEYSADALADGNVSAAIDYAMQAIPRKRSLLDAPVTAQAQKALTDALGVYELSDVFMALDGLRIPAAPFHVQMSPDGKKIAVTYAYEMAVYSIADGKRIAVEAIEESALSDVYFVDDSSVIYAAADGLTLYDIDSQKALWKGKKATTISVSSDKKIVASVNRDEQKAFLYRLDNGEIIAECDFGGKSLPIAQNDIFADPEDEIFALNEDGTLLAVSFSDGSLTVFDIYDPDNSIIVYEDSDYTHFDGGFYGTSCFAYIANGPKDKFFGMIDTSVMEYIANYSSQNFLQLKTGESGFYLADGNTVVEIDAQKLDEKELAYIQDAEVNDFYIDENYCIVSSDKKNIYIFDRAANTIFNTEQDKTADFVRVSDQYAVMANRDEAFLRIIEKKQHSDHEIFSYDVSESHDEVRLSNDETTLMLFDYKHFSIYDTSGKKIKEIEIPNAESIYDQQFRKNDKESYLEVIWYDGTVIYYSAKDGSILREDKTEKPDETLYEEFETENYKVTSSLHGTPEVYEKKSDRLIGKLNQDDYLTYFTELDEWLIAEYISTDGTRYGLLMNDKLETLAYLPDLCDVTKDRLLFDDGSGKIKQSSIYSLDDLLLLGDTYKSN